MAKPSREEISLDTYISISTPFKSSIELLSVLYGMGLMRKLVHSGFVWTNFTALTTLMLFSSALVRKLDKC